METMYQEQNLPEEAVEGYTPLIHDDREAERALRKIAAAKADKASWGAFYDEQKEKSNAQYDNTILYWEWQLEQYFLSVPHKKAKSGKSETYTLPSGKLTLKAQDPEYKRDNAVLLEWLKANDMFDYIKTTEQPAWSDMKKDFKISGDAMISAEGEIIPGIVLVPRENKFVVTANGGGSNVEA